MANFMDDMEAMTAGRRIGYEESQPQIRRWRWLALIALVVGILIGSVSAIFWFALAANIP